MIFVIPYALEIVNISQYNKPITFEPHICKKDGYYGTIANINKVSFYYKKAENNVNRIFSFKFSFL